MDPQQQGPTGPQSTEARQPGPTGPLVTGVSPYSPAGPPVSALPYPDPFVPPPARPGHRAFVALVATAALLTIALIVTAVVGGSSVSHLRREVSTRQAQRAADHQRDAAAAVKLQADFRAAALDTKFDHIKELDRAVDAAIARWHGGNTPFRVIDTAIDTCDDAIAEYDRLAAPFPDDMFGAVPKLINLNNPATDCGRAVTDTI